MYLCDYCIQGIRSHGEKVYVGEFHSCDEELKCDSCGDKDDVYECEMED